MDIFFPIQTLADWIAFTVLGLARENVWGEAINFFIYDSIKILLLLCTIIFAVSYIRSYLPPEKIKDFLTKRAGVFGNVLAALFGTITPFCSCSAVPLFIGLVESGVPLGVTFSYLISAPMVNEVAAVLLFGLFGWKVALIYIVSGVTIAIVVGYILGKMKLEPYVEDYVWKIRSGQQTDLRKKTRKEHAQEAYRETLDIVKRVYLYVLIGVALGAFIHGYAPQDLLTSVARDWWAVPVAVMIGVPLYSNAAGTVPIVVSLIEKGLPLGTALAFMMSVTALSLPEMIILRKVLKPRLLVIYFGIVTLGIIFTGYLFNLLL
jgi:uncharacterized membrane protein YraQ (UPF0718 family)